MTTRDYIQGEVAEELVSEALGPTIGPEAAVKAMRARKGLDPDEGLLLDELRQISQRRPEAEHIANIVGALETGKPAGETDYLTGLALSGGGIRSAIFSLGVMQKLAGAGVLKRFDYLSTVSGGGYIGSALTWWLNGKSGGPSFDLGTDFPYGTRDPAEPDQNHNPILRYLRENGRYLTPGAGLTVWSGIAIVLRAVLLNLLIWVPLVAVAFWALIWTGQAEWLNGLPHMIDTLRPDLLRRGSEAVGAAQQVDGRELIPALFLAMLIIVAVILALFVIAAFNYSLLAWSERNPAGKQAAETKPDSTLRNIARWLAIAAVFLIGLAIVAMLAQWTVSLKDLLFRQAVQHGADLTGYGTSLLRAFALFAFIAAGAAVLVLIEPKRRTSKHEWLRYAWVFAPFAVLFAIAVSISKLAADHAAVPAVSDPVASPVFWYGLVQLMIACGLIVLVLFWIGAVIRWLQRDRRLALQYGERRQFEILFGWGLAIATGLAVLGSVPLVVHVITFRLGGMEGLFGIAAGVVTSLWGQARSQTGTAGRWTNLMMIIGAGLFLYGLLLLGYRLATAFAIEREHDIAGLVMVLFFIGLLSGWFTNLNKISLHRFYRDRLMEAFLPDYTSALSGARNGAPLADDMRISKAFDAGTSTPAGPYHIINTNVVLLNSANRTHRLRHGDNFILSPFYSGSNATGWGRTDRFMDDEITLASAMATSGAAANPGGGVGGRGVTTNRLVSTVMRLLNFRLGYWVRQPDEAEDKGRIKWRPNHFDPGARYSIPGVGYKEDSLFLELSDGGHFENLGVYELARRRCGLIVVCDGGQDNKSSYADLITLLQRMGPDFDARADFDLQVGKGTKFAKSGPERLIPRERDDLYPKAAEFAEKGYFVATIDYGRRGGGAWPQKALLIYLKTTMIPELEIKAKGYKGAHPDFPDQTTADQFFDEEQFEAYREAGFRIAEQMVEELDLAALLKQRPKVGELRNNPRIKPV